MKIAISTEAMKRKNNMNEAGVHNKLLAPQGDHEYKSSFSQPAANNGFLKLTMLATEVGLFS